MSPLPVQAGTVVNGYGEWPCFWYQDICNLEWFRPGCSETWLMFPASTGSYWRAVDEGAIVWDLMHNSFIGFAWQPGVRAAVVYDEASVIKSLADLHCTPLEDTMSAEARALQVAQEMYEKSIRPAVLGSATPVFFRPNK